MANVSNPDPIKRRWPYPFWIAHRGGGRLAPENTLAAFRTGAQHGYRMFECDAKLSRDGVVFLLHDSTLERTTSGHGVAGEHNWSELSQLDAGGHLHPQWAGETLPTLYSVARFCLANGYFINIEIKPTPGTERETGRAVAHWAAQWWANASAPPLLSSFAPAALAAAQQAAPELPRGLLLDTMPSDWLTSAQSLQCSAIVADHTLWNPARVRQAHAAGMRCLSYTVNQPNDVQRLTDLGTDGIITDAVDDFTPSDRCPSA